MNSVDCLILDFGNVVAYFDHMRACRQLAKLTSHGLTETDVYRTIFESGLEDRYDRGVISTETFLRTLQDQLKIDADSEQIVTAWSDIFWPNEAVIEWVRRARPRNRPRKLILASNTNDLHHQWINVQFGDVLQCFDHLVLSYQITHRKPETEFYESCLEASECDADRCLFVDDREVFVEAARTAGMNGVVYTRDVDLQQYVRSLDIDSDDG